MNKYGKMFLDVIDSFCFKKKIPRPDAQVPPASEDVSAPASIDYEDESPVGKVFFRVGEAYNGGCSIPELIRMFKVKEETIISNLLKYIQAGNTIRSDGILAVSTLTSAQQAQVTEIFLKIGAQLLAPVYNELNGQIDYPQLRIMQLYFFSCAH
jgi:hypothetical protein